MYIKTEVKLWKAQIQSPWWQPAFRIASTYWPSTQSGLLFCIFCSETCIIFLIIDFFMNQSFNLDYPLQNLGKTKLPMKTACMAVNSKCFLLSANLGFTTVAEHFLDFHTGATWPEKYWSILLLRSTVEKPSFCARLTKSFFKNVLPWLFISHKRCTGPPTRIARIAYVRMPWSMPTICLPYTCFRQCCHSGWRTVHFIFREFCRNKLSHRI